MLKKEIMGIRETIKESVESLQQRSLQNLETFTLFKNEFEKEKKKTNIENLKEFNERVSKIDFTIAVDELNVAIDEINESIEEIVSNLIY